MATKIEGDQDRIEAAVREGDRMLGPKERHRCGEHPRRWVVYRWTWGMPDDGDHMSAIQSDSWPETIRECKACADESDAELRCLA